MTRRRLVAIIGGGALGAVLVATAGYASVSPDVPRGTSVAGVEIGDLTYRQAEEALRTGIAADLARPIEVTVERRRAKVRADRAGIDVDYAASVRDATGGSRFSPVRLYRLIVGGHDHDPVITVDDAAMAEEIARLNDKIGEHVIEGTIEFRDGVATAVPGQSGSGIDPVQGPARLVAGVLAGEVVDLPVREIEPTIDRAILDEAMTSFAEPAMAAPVVIEVPGAKARLRPKQFGTALSMHAEDGTLVPRIDPVALEKVLGPVHKVIGSEPRDAAFEIRDGKPRVVPGKVGATVDPAEIAERLPAVLPRPKGERVIKMDIETVEPEFTTADAKALGIKEEVSTFTTYYPHATYRNVNLGRAAELIDGTILRPGETFSLNGVVGERTRENGFTAGWIIKDGIFREDLGGGVSQIATTTFNAMFFAGLEDIEHKAHSVYIDRYPEGREATVAWPTLDLKFKNDTSHGILVKAHVNPSAPGRQGAATVTMYSTKTWEITATKSGRYAFTSPKERWLDAPDCEPTRGSSGFSVDVERRFAKPKNPNKIVRTEKFHTVYIPADTLKCGTPPKPGGKKGEDD